MWIETQNSIQLIFMCSVTPHTGVWIETRIISLSNVAIGSRPMRACGLKHYYPFQIYRRVVVTPHAGVWIETGLFELYTT